MLCRADSMNELTETGKMILNNMRLIFADTENHWGDLTSYGQKQHRGIAQRMSSLRCSVAKLMSMPAVLLCLVAFFQWVRPCM